MLKYSTPNDLLRQLHEEETEEENLFAMKESLAIVTEMLDRLFVEPSEECIRNVLEYSRSLNLR